MSQYRGCSDEELAILCLEGDGLAWEALVKRHGRLLCSIAARLGFRQDDPKDIAQEVWRLFLSGLDDLRERGKVRPWLITTTTRLCLARLEQKLPVAFGYTFEEPWDSALSQEQLHIWRETQNSVHDAVEMLPERCRSLLQTLYYKDGTYEDAAKVVDLSRNAVGRERARCLERLRQMLAARGITSLG